MGSIYISQPWWFVVTCLLVGSIAAFILYYKAAPFQEKPFIVRASLAAVRGFVISLLCFLLLAPLLKRIDTEVKKPIILVLQDASESIAFGANKTMLDQLGNAIDELKASLSDDYAVETYAFGKTVREESQSEFKDNVTDIEQALSFAREAFDQQRLGAVIMLSDGLFNKGSNPLYSNTITKVPLFNVALGDPTPIRDLTIKRLFHNKVAYKGDRFTIQIDLLARNAKGEKSELKVYDITSGKPSLVTTQAIGFDQDPYFQTREIILNATAAGVRRYRFSLTSIPDERNQANNTRDMYIEILDARQKILLLADAPHPDLASIRQSLSTTKNYQVDIRFAKDQGLALKTYDLVILHQIPSIRNPASVILQEAKQARVPLWFILGSQSSIPSFNRLQNLLTIRSDGKNMNEIQGQIDGDFQVFTLSEDVRSRISQFPAMLAPFGDFTVINQGFSLLNQRIGAINTNYPLWLVGEENQIKFGVLAAEGLWKWRMFDFLQHKNYDIVDELISKTVNYLAVQEDKRRLRVQPSRQIFNENEPLRFDGELYNEGYELITDPDIQIIIKNEEGKEFVFLMNKSATLYSLQAGLFPPGNYTFVAKATHNQQNLSYDGRFSIEPVDQELADLQADHNLLRLLSDESGGLMVAPADIASLEAIIRENQQIKPVMYSSIQSKPLIHWKWLFALLIILLGAEWFIRRYQGSY